MRACEFVSEQKSAAMDRTARDLVNPPRIMQHRARRDQEREQQYINAQRKKEKEPQ